MFRQGDSGSSMGCKWGPFVKMWTGTTNSREFTKIAFDLVHS